ncbi:aldo/keto reductase [Streptomyces sp. NPDC051183]|uniref:aldo/keto reductase n=1 Tax=Streptomyces sp. NPDC051183 TaxID=3155165 RepID=UPI003416B4A5
MEYRQLGTSGLKVPALSFGAGTFGGQGPLFGAWGTTDAQEARRLVDICLEAGITMFDTADVYSAGASEEQLRQNIGAIGWTLDPEMVARLDAASHRPAPYPYFPYERQEAFARLNPPMIPAP